MTYSINTSKYTAKKAVEINGKMFKVRRFTTDEQFNVADLQAQARKVPDDDTNAARDLYNKCLDIFFGLFDDQAGAREVLDGIDLTNVAEIYQDIMENAPNAVDD